LESAPGAGAGRATEGVKREKRVRKSSTTVVIIEDVLVFMIISKRLVVGKLDT
jgi:hypothetical protein